MALKEIRNFGVKISLLFDKSKLGDLTKGIESVASEMKTLGLEVGGASATLFGFTKAASSTGRYWEQTSARLGENVEQLEELAYAMKVAAGVSKEELAGSLDSLNKTLFEARNNNTEAADDLRRLGVTEAQLANPTTKASDLFMTLADSLSHMEDGAYKSAIAAKVGIESMLPAIKKGVSGINALRKEGRDSGAVVTKEQIAINAEYDRQLTRILIVFKSIANLVGNQLIKNTQKLVVEFRQWVVENRKFLAQGIGKVMKGLATYLELVFKFVGYVFSRFKDLVEILGGVEKVSKMVAIAFAAIAGIKMISAVGSLISGLKGVLGVLGLISSPAFLIGAAFAAIILVIQDLTSSDSIIKEWIKNFSDKFPNAMKLFSGAFEFVTASAKALWEWLGKTVSSIEDWISGIDKAYGVASKLKGLFETGTNWLGEKAGKAGEWLHEAAQSIGGKGPAPNSMVTNANRSNVQQSATVNVTVGNGMSLSDTVHAVSSGVQDAFTSPAMLRSTRDQFLGGVAQ